jgi:hypothetical protein
MPEHGQGAKPERAQLAGAQTASRSAKRWQKEMTMDFEAYTR